MSSGEDISLFLPKNGAILTAVKTERRGEDLESKSIENVRGYKMRIAVCDDQAEVLLAVERMFSGGG